MKRSEMVVLMSLTIATQAVESGNVDMDLTWLDTDKLLEMMEQNGMLPPADEGNVKIEEGEDGQLYIPIWRWEDEEEV
jgi:hypothetical protein